MIECPSCEYKNGRGNVDLEEDIYGDEGNFFILPIKMEQDQTRYGRYSSPRQERVYGCPRCGNLFMNI